MIISDVNLLAPTITLAVGIALGYRFRGLIAREDAAAHKTLQHAYVEVMSELLHLKQRITSPISQVEKAL